MGENNDVASQPQKRDDTSSQELSLRFVEKRIFYNNVTYEHNIEFIFLVTKQEALIEIRAKAKQIFDVLE